MRLTEFKQKLIFALGKDLEHATPANVREFVDSIQQELYREEHPQRLPGQMPERIEIPLSEPLSYEALMRSFFVRALSADRDQSLIQLWILAIDLAYTGIEDMQSEQMQRLFNSDLE